MAKNQICATSTPCQAKNFDYQQLNYLTREQIQKLTLDIKNRLRRCAKDIVEIGNNLCIIKQQLQHGQFRNWLKAEFDWSVSTANKFMQVSKQFKPEDLEKIEIAPSALYILAAPSTPDEVRTQALNQAKQGNPITFSFARQLLEENKTSENGFKATKKNNDPDCSTEEETEDVLVVETSLSYSININEYSSQSGHIYNFSEFNYYLEQEWRRMARTQQDLSLILCQVCFKNSKKPKLVTDKTIQQITYGLAQTVKRAGDFVGSYCNNQLGAVLPDTNLAGSKHVAKEFLAWFTAKKKDLSVFHHLQAVTLSLGVASIVPDNDTTYEVLIQSAQRALLETQKYEDNQIKTYR